ncbi:unnamed protein product, partial [Scytosiphon promiscuus]
SRTTACCLRTQPIYSILHATIYVQRSVFIYPSWAALPFSVRASLLSSSFSDVVAPPFGPSSLTLSVELPLDPGFNRSASACASIYPNCCTNSSFFLLHKRSTAARKDNRSALLNQEHDNSTGRRTTSGHPGNIATVSAVVVGY